MKLSSIVQASLMVLIVSVHAMPRGIKLSIIGGILNAVNREAADVMGTAKRALTPKSMLTPIGEEMVENDGKVEFSAKHRNNRDQEAGKDLPQDVVRFSDIKGLDHALAEVTEVANYLKNKAQFRAMGAKGPKGILLEGPPGCGKTMIAKAMACEASCSFLYASGSEFVEIWVGQGPARVRELFNKARSMQPCIIFLDEFDALGAIDRGDRRGGSNEYAQTLNQLLVELDGFNTTTDILVIAATNYASSLDSAVVRAGRFDRLIKIPLPDAKARQEILQSYIDKLPRVAVGLNDVIKEIAEEGKGLTGADLSLLSNEAAIFAVREAALCVQEHHLRNAFLKIKQQRLKTQKPFLTMLVEPKE